jgi:hypothetical protein
MPTINLMAAKALGFRDCKLEWQLWVRERSVAPRAGLQNTWRRVRRAKIERASNSRRVKGVGFSDPSGPAVKRRAPFCAESRIKISEPDCP